MTAPTTRGDRTRLQVATSLLDTVGRTASRGTVATRCLLAADLLVRAGADPASTGGPALDERDGIGQALELLGALTESALGDENVLEAMHHALLAHAATR